MYALYYTLEQLNRLQDRVRTGSPLRIIHVLSDYSDGFATHWEDRYIVLVDCDPKTYTLYSLL